MESTQTLDINTIVVGPNEVRFDKNDPDLQDLARSIKELGLHEPLILVRRDDGLHLSAGHRRYRACKEAGVYEVPVRIYDADEERERQISFAENFFRKDLTPVEIAVAIGEAMQHRKMSTESIARAFHRSAHWVQRKLAILEWPDDVLGALNSGHISEAAASNLALVTNDVYRDFLVRQAIESGATARTTAAWLQAWRSSQPMEDAINAEIPPGQETPVPMTPQAPCICCGDVFRVDMLSHVPTCPMCIKRIRELGKTL